jgi:hypothetical protein
VGLTAFAAPVTIPYVFSSGTPARAPEMNANFSVVAMAHNDTDARFTAAHADTTARISALELTARQPNLKPIGNLVLGPSNPSSGNILKDTEPFIHNYGESNVFVGLQSGNFSTTAQSSTALGHSSLSSITTANANTAVGALALHRTTTGSHNSAFGLNALLDNTTGGSNTAIGSYSLESNTTGVDNVAVGYYSLGLNTAGSRNTAIGGFALRYAEGSNNLAIGDDALNYLLSGNNNIALGTGAGEKLRTGNTNIYLGHTGYSSSESSTLRLGQFQNRAFISGVRGRQTSSTNVVPVVIDEFGQLGTIVSSRRHKENIADMGDASSLLMRLRPVTFKYREDGNPAGPALQYGLIAEEVAGVAPGLVAHTANGDVETVFYEFLPPMLLNEFQKQQRSLNAQKARIAELENTVAVLAQQAQRTAALLARLERTQAAN